MLRRCTVCGARNLTAMRASGIAFYLPEGVRALMNAVHVIAGSEAKVTRASGSGKMVHDSIFSGWDRQRTRKATRSISTGFQLKCGSTRFLERLPMQAKDKLTGRKNSVNADRRARHPRTNTTRPRCEGPSKALKVKSRRSAEAGKGTCTFSGPRRLMPEQDDKK
jgi:hypothetical protein